MITIGFQQHVRFATCNIYKYGKDIFDEREFYKMAKRFDYVIRRTPSLCMDSIQHLHVEELEEKCVQIKTWTRWMKNVGEVVVDWDFICNIDHMLDNYYQVTGKPSPLKLRDLNWRLLNLRRTNLIIHFLILNI